MQHPQAARRQAQPTGVIETLSAGYAALNRQLWVLLLPVLVDVFLWLGPHVSYSPLLDPALNRATEWTREVAPVPRRGVRATQFSADLDSTRQWLLSHTDDLNALEAVAWGPLALPAASLNPGATHDFTFMTGWGQGVALLLGCAAAGLVLGAWFYGGLAAASTGAAAGPLRIGRGVPRALVRVVGLMAVLLGTGALLGVPVVLLVAFTALLSPPVAVLGAVLLAAAVIFAALHLFFAVDAIFVSNVGPLAAVQRSVGLVRRQLWPSLAFIVLTCLILAGMARVWDVLASTFQAPYGAAVGMLGNAYIASGLIAAGMIFYTERASDLSGATTHSGTT